MPSTCWAPGLRLIPARQTPLLHEAAAGPRLRPPLMPWDATRGLCCCVCCVPKEGCRADGCTNGLPVAKAPRHATLWMELDGRPWWGSWTGFTVWRGAGSEKGRRGPRAGKPGESVTVLPRYVLRSLTASRAGCRASRPLGGLYKAPACTDGSGCFGGGCACTGLRPPKRALTEVDGWPGSCPCRYLCGLYASVPAIHHATINVHRGFKRNLLATASPSSINCACAPRARPCRIPVSLAAIRRPSPFTLP